MGTYRTAETYEANYAQGPDFDGPYPAVPPTPNKSFLGQPVRSRVGIAAGLLLNAKWIEVYARLGYDILTYKTVRSAARPCYPLPNWVRLDVAGELPDDPEKPLVTAEPVAVEDDNVTWAVCFGMPSAAPDVWRPDIEKAKVALESGQLLNVSVVGTPADGGGLDEMADDFARCAAWAVESGADLIEINLSCPNVCTAEGQIYHDPEASRTVAQRVRARIGQTPLLAKLGPFPNREATRLFLRAASGVIDAIVMVNAIQRRLMRPDGRPAFGEIERAGILGRALHQPSLQLVRDAVEAVREESLSIAVCGVGGVLTPRDAHDFFDAGADAAFLGSGPMVRPNLAVDIKQAHPEL